MTCVFCMTGRVAPGLVTATLERDHAIVVIRKVPAVVCGQCGESYFDGPTAARLLILVDAVIASGAKIEIRDYAA